MPFHSAADEHVQPAPAPGAVACRCCPGGISGSTRARRYPPDMSRAEWALCEPLLPAPAWLAGRGGRPARWCMRDIVDAIRYLTHNGPVWRPLPADSQSVKGSEMIGQGRRGYDAGKKINGTKRHLAVDALGLLLTVLVTAACVQDRDAAKPLL